MRYDSDVSLTPIRGLMCGSIFPSTMQRDSEISQCNGNLTSRVVRF